MLIARTLRTVRLVTGATLAVATTLNALATSYLGLLTAVGASPPKARPHGIRPTTRFAILVPAHNEEAVISDSLRSFSQIDYPAGLFDVHVVADNCSDRTSDIARAHGVHVHERHDPDQPGKGLALNWLFGIVDRGTEFDVAVVVDADTIVDEDFLRAMDAAFRGGAVVAQGFYSVRDPAGSTSASLRYAALACRHHLRAQGRCRLGASCGLYGNGMAFRREVLRRRRWTGHLVEDAEFQMELLLWDGDIVTYVPQALIHAEMPGTLEAARTQNERWERGRIELGRRYLPILMRQLVQARRHRRIAVADAIADHLVPPLSVMATAQLVTTIANGLAISLGVRRSRGRAKVDVMALAVLGAHVFAGLRSVSAPRSVYFSITRAPAMVLWKLRLWRRILQRRTEVGWQRTPRNAER